MSLQRDPYLLASPYGYIFVWCGFKFSKDQIIDQMRLRQRQDPGSQPAITVIFLFVASDFSWEDVYVRAKSSMALNYPQAFFIRITNPNTMWDLFAHLLWLVERPDVKN